MLIQPRFYKYIYHIKSFHVCLLTTTLRGKSTKQEWNHCVFLIGQHWSGFPKVVSL